MASVNRVILVGNVGAIKTKVTDKCTIANVSLATNETYKDAQTNSYQKVTVWHNVTAFNSVARYIDNYVQKGDKIYIEGKLQTSKYIDKDNIERTRTEIIANQAQGLTYRKDEQHNDNDTTLSNDYF